MFIYRISCDPNDLVVTTVEEIKKNPRDKTVDIYFYEVEPNLNSSDLKERYPDCHVLEYREILDGHPTWRVYKSYRCNNHGSKTFYFDHIDDAINCAMKPFYT